MLIDKLQEIYLDYANNYLTARVFGEHNGLTESQAKRLIDLGRECHETLATLNEEES